MAACRKESFARYFTLFFFLYAAKFILGDECPQQIGDTTSNQKARNLAGSRYVQLTE
jgi:hypothetical protein